MEIVTQGEFGPISVFLTCPYLASLETLGILHLHSNLRRDVLAVNFSSFFQVAWYTPQVAYFSLWFWEQSILAFIEFCLLYSVLVSLIYLQLYIFLFCQNETLMYCFLYVTQYWNNVFFIIEALLPIYWIKSHLFVKFIQVLIY